MKYHNVEDSVFWPWMKCFDPKDRDLDHFDFILQMWFNIGSNPTFNEQRYKKVDNSPMMIDTPFYVRDKATCDHITEAVISDYEKTQPGFKVNHSFCMVQEK